MKKIFRNMSFFEIVGFSCFLLVVLTIGKHMLDNVAFYLAHSHPVPTSLTKKEINVLNEPIQQEEPKRFHHTTVYGNITKKPHVLDEVAYYSISGLLVAKNTKLGIRGLTTDSFDDVVPIDIGMAWGENANKPFLKKYAKFKSKKTLGEWRVLESMPVRQDVPEYVENYLKLSNNTSHTHVIPSNKNVLSAIYKIKIYDKAKLDGYLIDINHPDGTRSLTSVSRLDTNATSRGAGYMDGKTAGGACEIMYVNRVQIGNKIYE